MDMSEIRNRTRLALELREGEWLVAASLDQQEAGQAGDKVLYAVDWASVLEGGLAGAGT